MLAQFYQFAELYLFLNHWYLKMLSFTFSVRVRKQIKTVNDFPCTAKYTLASFCVYYTPLGSSGKRLPFSNISKFAVSILNTLYYFHAVFKVSPNRINPFGEQDVCT